MHQICPLRHRKLRKSLAPAERSSVAPLTHNRGWLGWWLLLALWLPSATLGAQQSEPDIPDAPSATKPSQQLPNAPSPPQSPPQEPPAENSPPSPHAPSAEQPVPSPQPPAEQSPSTPPPPMPPVTTVPPGSVPAAPSNARSDLTKIAVNVNFVLVPVTVKDGEGRLVGGLQAKDFRILEDGVEQKLRFFTSAPLYLSAAIVVDVGMPDVALQKVNTTYSALLGAFGQYDEVGLYTYSIASSRQSDFTAAVNPQLTARLSQLKAVTGRNNGPPVTSGPLASPPSVNGHPVDSPVQPVVTPPKESHVLNDAVLMAALDLSKLKRDRRKIIFIISDGREYGSNASYRDVLKVLLSNDIIVYGLGVGSAALPAYGKLQRLTHLPRMGYSDILPKYANATGGEVFNELTRQDMERAYAQAMGDARNQYTLGYTTRATPSSRYRQIEVRVRRPDLSVTAKDGYYPLPPGR